MTGHFARIRQIFRYILTGRLDHLRYALWVRGKGLDFGRVSLDALGLNSDHSGPHSASGGVFLADVLRRIDIPPGSRVVDLGCGKGSAMCTLARFPFEEVAGVELSEPLARIAEANARKLRLKNLRIYVSDATEFKDFDRFTHIYLFNSFPGVVLTEVMKNLAVSLSRKPRKLTMISFFPERHDVVMQSGLFRKEMEIDFKLEHPYYVYVHDSQTLGTADRGGY